MKKSKKKIYIGIGIVIVIIASTLLYLFLSKEKYTITFKVDDEVYKIIEKIPEGKTIDLPSNPKKDGYTFNGWYINDKKFDSNDKIENNLELEAKFTINTYTITFDFDNEDENKEENVTYNEKVTKPKDPKKSGYNFVGWYVGNEEYDFDKPVEEDLTIKAKWTKKTTAIYTVEHYLMGLDGQYQDANNKEYFTGKIGNNVTPEVKTYLGFTSPEKQSVKVKEDGTTIVKYYYSRNKYTITVTGDSNVKSTTGSGTYYYGSNIKISATYEDGYEFNSWSNKANSNAFTYTVENSDINLKVTSKLTNYNLTIIGVFGNSEEKINTLNPSTYTIKDEVVLTPVNVEGYTFQRYTLNDENISKIEVGTKGNLTIKAIFEANPYKVTFKTTKGTFNTEEERSLIVKYKELIQLDLTDEFYLATREGYKANGWSLNTESEQQEAFDFNTPMVAHDIILYPIWETINYDINYDLKEDEICQDCAEYNSYNIESKFNLPIPSKSGYKFVGWQVNNTNEIITEIVPNRVNQITLSAKWVKIINEEYVDSILNKETSLINTIKDGEVLVGIKDLTSNISLIKENLIANITQLLEDENIIGIEITANDTPYTFNRDNIETTIDNLIESLVAPKELNTATFADIIDQVLNVKISLNQELAISSNNSAVLAYKISFRELEKVNQQELSDLVDLNEYYINSHKQDHYEVVVEDKNLIFKYSNPNSYVFTSMIGAGLKTAMQTFLGNNNIDYIIVTLEGMDPVKVTYDDIKETRFYSFGWKLLDSFEAVVGKDAFQMYNKDLLKLHAKLEIFAPDGKYFDDSFPTEYNISFAPQD